MRSKFTKINFILFLFIGLWAQSLHGQSMLNPTDAVVTYNPSARPTQPAYGQIGKWVRTVRMGWNSDDYKAYIYNGHAFRLKFPKTYNPTVNDGKKYPIMIFFHGYGEKDSIYDNEFQLYHGGDLFQTAINNGTFDGYALFMESTGYWGSSSYQAIIDLVNYMITNNKLDPFQIMLNGLSAGGQGVWEILNSYPSYFCAAMPMSWSSTYYTQAAFVNTVKFTPVWLSQGGLDGNPAPYTTHQVRDAMLNAGANFKLTEYPNTAHNTWDGQWNNMDFWPFFKKTYSSNPWTLGGKTQFFPGEAIQATIGLNAGFDGYQWRKDGALIAGASTNSINVTQLGLYDARVQRNGLWSDWSRTPVTLTMATYTLLPATIQASNYNAMSGVLTESTSDAGGGLNVGYIDNGDWMDYSISVPTTGNYVVSYRLASPYNGASLDIRASDRTVLGSILAPNTGGWQNWQTVSDTIKLSSGFQTLRLVSTGASGWNIHWISISAIGSPTPTPTPAPAPTPTVNYTALPATIAASKYDKANGVMTEPTTDVGGGLDVGYINPGSWMDYNVNPTITGVYTLSLRVAAPISNAQFELRAADGTVLATINPPNTGGWQNWQTITTTINLTTGNQTLRIYALTGGWNLNSLGFEISTPGAIIRSNASVLVPLRVMPQGELNVYPVPARDAITLAINNPYKGKLLIQLVGMNGIVQKEYRLSKNEVGNNQVNCSISDLPRGEYFLRAQMEGWKQAKKIIKL
ncbi:MAG: hypothetical protein NVS9B7_10180 [Flavisolibacter sp.]